MRKKIVYISISLVVLFLLVSLVENNIYRMKQVSAATTKQKHKEITITVTGDILLDKSVGRSIETYGEDYPFKSVGPILRKSDLTAGNLETSVSLRGTAQQKQFTFRSKPRTLQGLVNAGYDMVSLANNHTLDYGSPGLLIQ